MCNMVSAKIETHERDDLRLGFYRAHKRQSGFSSVALRRDKDRGTWYLDVGANGKVDVPSSYRGLEVRVQQASRAVNAVAPFASLPAL
jgi:hypothetical protein